MSKPQTSFSTSLQIEESTVLQHYLAEHNFDALTPPAHVAWRFSGQGVNILFYQSGKLVVQGKGTDEFVRYTLENRVPRLAGIADGVSEVNASHRSMPQFTENMIGMDESGKGDFFGPLIACSAYVDESKVELLQKLGVKDCKTVSDTKIISMAQQVQKILSQQNFSIVILGNDAYNRMYERTPNVNKILAWAHARALENLLEKGCNASKALLDKFSNSDIVSRTLMEKGRHIELIQRTKAESELAVATASVLARSAYLQRMNALSSEFNVGLLKGAGTQVLALGKSLWREHHDVDFFSKIAKLHFKTFDDIKNDCELA